ncbi:beta strand repeat-containing protein [Patescibacteria group bacterium]
MTLEVTAYKDFTGEIIERVPREFGVEVEYGGASRDIEGVLELVWDTSISKGDTITLGYTFKSPEVSPALYHLGPATIGEWSEGREWQLAIDPTYMYLYWDGAGPPTGWSVVSTYDGKFARGETAANFGITSGNATHTPTIATQSPTSQPGTTKLANSGFGYSNASGTHTHAVIGTTIGSANNLPAYRDLILIKNDTGIPATIPGGGIAFFDDDPGLPGADWTRQSAQDAKMTRTNSSVATAGSDTHTHTITWAAPASGRAGAFHEDNCIKGGSAVTHGHTAPSAGATTGMSALPPYIEVIVGKADSDTSVPSGIIPMFDADPGAGWDLRSDSGDDFYQNFVRGAAAYNGSSQGATTHNHAQETSGNTGSGGSVNGGCGSGTVTLAGSNHNHTETVTFTTGTDNMPEYWNVVYAEMATTADTVSGSVKGTDESSFIGNPPCDGVTAAVSLKINGAGTDTTDCDNTTGNYEFSGLTFSAGDTVSVYLNSNSTEKANLNMVIGSANVTDADLYEEKVIVRDENDGTSTILDMVDYDNDQNSTDMLFDADDLATDTLSTESGKELHIWTGDTLDPNGDVDTGSDIHIDDSATMNLDTATSTIGGDIDVDTSATLNVSASATVNGNDVTTTGAVNHSAGTFTIGDSTTEDFIVNGGTVTLSGGTTVLKDDFDINGGTITISNTMNINGNSAAIVDQDGGTLNINAGADVNALGANATYAIDGASTILNLNGGSFDLGQYWFNNEGTVNLNGGDHNIGTGGQFRFGNAAGKGNVMDFNMTGGEITTPIMYTFDTSTLTTTTVTGGTINLGVDGVSDVIGEQNTDSHEFYNFVIEENASFWASSTVPLNLVGSFTINNGKSFDANAEMIVASGGWVNNGTYTYDTSTVTLLGGNISGTSDTTFYNLNIGDATTTGTVTLTGTDDPIVNGTLDVDAGDTLSIGASRTVQSNSTGSLTLDGTISGAGKLIYEPAAAFPTSGTISSILRFDTTVNNQTMGATRTYGGAVEIYNNSASARSVTGAAGTITMSSTLDISRDGAGGVTLELNTNDPTTIIGDDVTIGVGTTLSANSANGITMNGSFTNSGTFTSNNGTVTFGSGSPENITTGGGSGQFYNLTFDGTGPWTPLANEIRVGGDLHMVAGTLQGSQDLWAFGDIECNGTCGTITFSNNSVFIMGAGQNIGTNVAEGDVWTFHNLDFIGGNVTFNGSGTGTIIVNGTMQFVTGTADNETNDRNIDVVDVIIAGGTYQASSSATFKVSGSWTKNSGTFTPNSGTITFDNDGASIGGSQGTNFNNLTIDPAAPHTSPGTVSIDISSGYILVNDTLNIASNDSVSIAVNDMLTIAGETGSITLNGTIEGSGILRYWPTSGFPDTGTVSSIVRYDTSYGTGHTITDRTYDGDVEFVGYISAKTQTADAGTFIFNGDVLIDYLSASHIVDFITNDPDVTIEGSLTIEASSVFQAPSSLTLNGDYSNSGTFTDGSGTVTLDGSGQQTLSGTMTGESEFNDLTITNNSGSYAGSCGTPTYSVIFAAAATINGTYEITTAGVRVQYLAGANYTVNGEINWTGSGGDSNLIVFRSSTTSVWNLIVDAGATQTAVSYVDVSYSYADGGATIDADDGTNINCLNNSEWDFDALRNISGYVKGTDESSHIGNPPCDNLTNNIGLRINGGSEFLEECSNAGETGSRDFYFANLDVVPGDKITIYIKGETEKANLVLVASGTDVNDLELYEDRVIVRDDNDGTMNVIDTNTWDNGDDSANMLFTATDASPDTLSVEANYELHVWTGDTLDSEGTITTQGTGDVHVDDNATMYFDNATNTVADDIFVDAGAIAYIDANTFVNGGSITTTSTGVVDTSSGTPTVTMFTSGAIGGGSGDITIYDLATIGGGTTSITGTGTNTISNGISVGDGTTLDIQQSLSVDSVGLGDFATAGSGSVTTTSGTPLVTLGSGCDIGGGSGSITFHDLTFGIGTHTFSSDFTVNNDLTFGAGGVISELTSTVTMAGTDGTGTLIGDNEHLYNLTIDRPGLATNISLSSSDIGITNNLVVETDDTFTIGTGRTAYWYGDGFTLNGTISGDGKLQVETTSPIATTGTFSADIYYDATDYAEMQMSARTYGGDVTIYNDLAQDVIPGGCTGGEHIPYYNDDNKHFVQVTHAIGEQKVIMLAGSHVISGNLYMNANDDCDIWLSGTEYNPTVTINGSIEYLSAPLDGREEIYTGASNTWTVKNDISISVGDFRADPTSTLVLDGSADGSATITSGGSNTEYGNLTLSGGNITFSDSYHQVYGNLDMTGASSIIPGSSDIWMRGSSKNIIGANRTLYDLTINPVSTSTITLQNSDLTVSNELTVSDGDTLTIASGRTLTHLGPDIILTGSPGGTITGAGTLQFTSASGGPSADGIISSVVRYNATTGNIANTTFDARTYGGKVELYSISAGIQTITAASGTYVFSGDLSTIADGIGLNIISFTANDPDVTVTGTLTIGGTTRLQASDSGTFNINGDYVNNGTFYDNLGTVTLGGSSQQSLSGSMTTSSNDFNNLIITNTSGSHSGCGTFTAGVDFDAAATISGTFTINTTALGDSVRVEYQDEAVYTVTNISWTGTAARPIIFRNSAIGTEAWDLNVTGSQTVTYVDVQGSNATGDTIDASDGTNTDCGENTEWQFANQITITGILYMSDEVTPATSGNGGPCDGSTLNLAVKVDGVGSQTFSCTSGAASFSLTNVEVDSGETIAIYQTSAQLANRIYVSDGTDDVGMHFFIDAVVVGDEADGTLSILDMIDWDNNDDSDMLFTAEDASPDTLVVEAGRELHIWTGDTFQPGGNITTAQGTGDIDIDGGTLAMEANTLTVGGGFNNDGVFTYSGTPTVTFNHNTAATVSIDGDGTGSEAFYNVTFNDASGGATYQLTGAMDIDNNMLLTGGTLNQNSNNITVGGNWTDNDIVTGTGTVIFDASDTDNTIIADPVPATFSSITFQGGDGSGRWTSNDNLSVSGTIDVDDSDEWVIGDGTSVITGTTTTLILNGTISGNGMFRYRSENTFPGANDPAGTGTISAPVWFEYIGGGNQSTNGRDFDGAVTVYGWTTPRTTTMGADGQPLNFNSDLTIFYGADTFIVDFITNDPVVTIDGNLTIDTVGSNGSVFSAPDSLTLSGDYTNYGTFTDNGGTVTLDGSAKQTLSQNMITTSDFNNLTITNSSGSWSGCSDSFSEGIDFAAAATISGTYTITTADVKVEYENGATYTVGDINFDGQDSHTPIVFRNSTLGSNAWNFETTSQTDVSFVNVGNSSANTFRQIDASNGTNTDCGGNINWNFGGFITIQGNAYTDEGVSALDGSGTPKTVNLRVNGAGAQTDDIVDDTGMYIINGVAATSGQIITVYLDNETEEATTVMVTDDTNQYNVDLYQNTVIARADTGSLTNVNMLTGDDGDDDVKYLVTGSDLEVDVGFELHILGGDTFAPGGDVTMNGDFHNVGNITSGLNTITMAANNSNFISLGTAEDNEAEEYYNLVFDVAGTGTVTQQTGDIKVLGALTVGADDTVSIDAGRELKWDGTGLSFQASSTISGSGALEITSDSVVLPDIGTLSSIVRFDATDHTLIMPVRPGIGYDGEVHIYTEGCATPAYLPIIKIAHAAGPSIVTMEAGTHDIASHLYLNSSDCTTGGNESRPIQLDADTNNPTVYVHGDIDYIGNSPDIDVAYEWIKSGTGTWTVSGDIDFENDDDGRGTYEAASGNTLIMDGSTKTLITNDNSFHNLTITGSVTFNDDVTLAGNLDIDPGTVTHGSNLVTMTGTSNTIDGGGNTLYDVTINPSSAGTITLQTSDLTVANTLTVSDADSLAIASGRTLTHTGATMTLSGATGGTISGAGTLRFTDVSGGPGTDGTISSLVRFDASGGNILNTTLDARTYAGDVEMYNSNSAPRTITAASGTYVFSGDLDTTTTDGITTLQLDTNDPTVTVNGTLTIGSFTVLQASNSSTLNIAGSFTRSGTFTHNSGTVALTTATAAVIDGSTTFNNLSVTGIGATKTITFTAGTTQTVAGTWTVTGASGQLVTLQSSTTSDWNINPTAASVSYVDVSYSNNQGVSFCATYSTNSGNNTNWRISSGANCNISGTVYDTTEGTEIGNPPCDGSTQVLTMYVNSTLEGTTSCVLFDATYSFGDISAEAGDIISIYLNSGADANTVLVYGGAGLSGVDLYEDRVIIRDDQDGTMSILDMVGWDNDNDSDMLFTATDGDPDTLVIEANKELHIWESDTFQPGGNVTTAQGSGDIHIGLFATMANEANTLTLGGGWNNDGAFTYSETPTVTFNNNVGGTVSIDGDGLGAEVNESFYNVVFDDGAGGTTFQLTGTTDADNNLTITGGNLSANGNNLIVGGNWDNNDTFTHGSATVTFDAPTSTKQIDSGGDSFNNVTFEASSGDSTWQILNENAVAVGDVDVDTGDTLSIGVARTFTWTGTSFTLDGTINGTGILVVNTTSTLGTGGTLNVITRFDSFGGINVPMPARDYGSHVQAYSNDDFTPNGSNYSSVIMGAGEHNIAGDFNVFVYQSYNIVLNGGENNPTVNVDGDLSFYDSGDGDASITSGTDVWTVSQDVDLSGGTYTATAGNTVKMDGLGTLTTSGNTLQNLEINTADTVTLAAATHTIAGNLVLAGAGTPEVAGSTIAMTGTSKTIDGGGKTLNNLTISGTATLQNTDLTVSGGLTVDDTKTLTIDAARSLTWTGSSFSLGSTGTGTIDGSTGTLIVDSSTTIPTNGTLDCDVRFDASNGNTAVMPARTGANNYGGDVAVWNTSGASARTVTMGTSADQEIDIGGNLTLFDSGIGITLEGTTYDPVVDIEGNLGPCTSATLAEFDTGIDNWYVNSDLDFNNCTYTATTGNTLIMDGTGNFNSRSQHVDNLTFSGTTTIQNTTLSVEVLGSLDMSGATDVIAGISTIRMWGAAKTIIGGDQTLHKLSISVAGDASVTLQTSDLFVSESLTINSSDSLTIADGIELDLTKTSGTTLGLIGTLNGPGRLIFRSTAFVSSGTLASNLILRMDATATNQLLGDREDYQILEIYNTSNTNARTVQSSLASGQVISGTVDTVITGSEAVTFDLDTIDANLTINGTVTIGAGTTLLASNLNTLSLGDSFTNSGTFNANSGSVKFVASDAGNTITSGSSPFFNIEFDNGLGGQWTLQDAMDVNGTYDLTAGTFIQGTNNDLNVAGDFTLAAAVTTFTKDAGTGLLIFDGDLTFTDNHISKEDVGNVEIGTSPDKTDLDSDLKANSITINNGDELETDGFDLDVGQQGLTIESGGLLDAADCVSGGDVCEEDETDINVTGDFDIQNGGDFDYALSTLTFDDSSGTSSLKTDGTGDNYAVYNLVVNGGATLDVDVFDDANDDDLVVKGDLTITLGELDALASDHAITVGGDWTNADTYTAQSNTVTFDGASAAASTFTIDSTGATIDDFYNIIFNDAADGDTFQLESALDVNNDLTITGGTLDTKDADDNSINVFGNWTNGDIFTANQSMVTFDGTSSGKTINAGSSSFYDVKIGNATGGHWSPLTNTLTITNDLMMYGGHLDTTSGTADVTVNGNVQCGDVCGYITMTTTNTFKQSVSANKNFGQNDGVGPTAAWTFYNLNFDSSANSPTITINGFNSGAKNINNNLSFTNSGTSLTVDNETNDRTFNVDGNVSIGAGATYQASSTASFTVAGNWTNNGDFTDGTGTITLDGTGQQTLSGQMTGASDQFYNLTITNASAANPDIIFDANAQTAGTFLANTADTQLQFKAASTYTFQNIDFDGQDENSPVVLRSSTTDTQWNLNVAGTRSVLSTDVQDSNACGQAPDIDATHVSNTDSGNNDCWNFKSITFTISSNTISLGNLSTGSVATASHTITTSTSADSGYITLVYDDGNLRKGADDINDVGDLAVTAGSEEYGISTTDTGQDVITDGGGGCSGSTYDADPITTTQQSVASASGPANEEVTICYMASIDANTVAGAYAHTVTFVTIGLF